MYHYYLNKNNEVIINISSSLLTPFLLKTIIIYDTYNLFLRLLFNIILKNIFTVDIFSAEIKFGGVI